MKTKLMVTILSILLVSGCVDGFDFDFGGGGVNLGGGSGLEIISFAATPTPVYGGGSVRLTMEVQNMGGTSVPTNEDLVWLTSSSGWTGLDEYTHFDVEMRTQDVVRGIEPNVKRFTWSLTAPSITAGQVQTDTFIGRVYSEYQTNVNGNIWVYSEQEADAATTAGRSLYTPTFTSTKGPVGLSVSVTPSPVILYAGETTFTLNIRVSNTASGTIYYPGSVTYASGSESISIDPDNLNKINLNVDVSGAQVESICNGEQEVVGGRDTTIVCLVTLPEEASFKSYAISIEATYGYFTEKTTTITVQGRTSSTT